MATASNSPCVCAACRFRRLTTPLVLIAIGVLFLAHMLAAGFTAAAMVGCFLVFVGALGLVGRLLPRPATHRLAASVFFPLLLLVIGVLVLLRHVLPQVPLGAWIATYWPLLLILWGLTRLLEHFARPARTRAGLSGGEILLVIVIVVFGLAFSGSYRFRHSHLANYWGVNFDVWNPFLQSYQFHAQTQASMLPGACSAGPAPAPVVVRGLYGDVTVTAATGNTISAQVSDTVRADRRTSAQRMFAAAQPVVRCQSGQWLVLPSGDASDSALRADLQVSVPARAPLTVQIQSGDITVGGWQAELDLQSRHGDIRASGVHGNVQVASGRGSVKLDHIAGSVSITGGGGDIAVANVAGTTRLEGEYVGSLQFANLAQGISFHSTRTSLAIAALPGTLHYDLGEIAITNADQVQLRTRNVSISIHDFRGPLTVESRNDAIRLATLALPTAPITITNRDSDISLTLPASSRFHLDATARNGDVNNHFGDAAHSAAPEIRLVTSNGDVTVRPPDGN